MKCDFIVKENKNLTAFQITFELDKHNYVARYITIALYWGIGTHQLE